ncbi:MAG: Phospholipase YtpA [Promethearchaeota archaeon]|nr:MAG: Phospholipase YtpA [Candidatus Lokiarchaeota archaeon]
MKNFAGFFEGRENTELYYQCWLPDEESTSKANIIAIHGWATHSDRIKYPAKYLTGKGYTVYSFDLRGHYRNIREIPGHIESIDHIQKDIVLFRELIKEQTENRKTFLIGHSFGGLISLIFAINHPSLPGVLVSSPQLGSTLDVSTGKKIAQKLAGPFAKINPMKVVDLNIPQNQLTSDLEILKEHIADKNKLEQMTVKSYAEMKDSMKWGLKNADKLTCPVFIMQAGKEKIVDKKKTKEFFEKVESRDKKYKEYDGFLHELWNEKRREQVYRDMWIWLEKHL